MNLKEKTSLIYAMNKLFAILLFGGALFIFSISTLNAKSDNKTFNFPDTLSHTDTKLIQTSDGKYQMDLQVVKDSEGKFFWFVLVWDTQTGKSKLYSKNKDKGTIPAHSGWQLPASPL
ncbi:MAG: hypothetical protein HRU50_09855 [Winogradskyella sp.]|uniref:hypothetical protein n=1 Tax=Winogradskyella sp. TaxID=1883156 RepID=UPI0025CCE480|nr:hypothetical protein [Winogradskyella sp.]NRB60223.1 hypothetical protein [Winogradskyella sp.]